MDNTMRVRTDRFFRAVPALLAALGVVAGAAPHAAQAAAYTYGARQRTVNAGVLLVDDKPTGRNNPVLGTSNGVTYAVDPTPYVFYLMNQRQDLKPFGWSIVNPIAPASITGNILQSWNARYPLANPAYNLNETVTPNMAAYWEVSLANTSLTDLEKFDVLFLNISQPNEIFTDTEVQTLRRYVDNGGQLWIEGTGVQGGTNGTISNMNPLFLDVSFTTASDTSSRNLPSFNIPGFGDVGYPQPIVQSPYLLTPTELNSLGTPTSVPYSIQGAVGTLDTTILSTVATGNALPVISAGQLGAGQIIVDSVGTGANINNSLNNPNDGAFCDSDPNDALTIPAADLKFAYNILSWATAHPNEYKNSHGSSQSAATLGPALTPTWTFTLNNASGTTPGAAINGNFVYVRTADGYLRAFNATPGTDIIGTGNPDAGVTDYSYGTPYDEVWDTAGTNDSFPGVATMAFGPDILASAPTVATINGTPVVFIESAAGKVYEANAVTGQAINSFGGSGNTPFPTTAPAPTYYEGSIYAGEPDGSLYVYDLTAGQGNDYVLNSTAGGTGTTPPPEYVTAPPTVGLVRESVNGFGNANASGSVDDIVVTVTTDFNTYTVHAGAWHDPLKNSGTAYTPGQASSMPFGILPVGANPTYNDDADGYQVSAGGTASGTGWTFNAPPPLPVFGDYSVDFQNTGAGYAARADFGIGQFITAPTSASISPSALDSNGNFYYTVNVQASQGVDSTLVCAHDSRSSESAPSGRLRATQILWRYRLPFSTEIDPLDANNVNDNPLDGFQFVGAPVVDNQGNVYALATNPNATTGSAVAVLCFNATFSPYITVPITNTDGTVNITELTQPAPTSASQTSGPDEFGNGAAQPVLAGTFQFNGLVDSNGNMTIQSFGGVAGGTGGQAVTPNLSEPQPVQATYTQSATGGTSTNTVTGLMHSNLNWYTLIPGFTVPSGTPKTPTLANPYIPTIAGLTLQGNYLFFAATPTSSNSSSICSLYAYPQSVGLVDSQRFYTSYNTTTGNNPAVQANGRAAFASKTTQVGAIDGVLSGGNGVLIANGQAGIAAFGTKYTLVADANRVMEVDSDGVPSWLVDSTSEINSSTGLITHLALNHPTSVTQVTSNDYLVADTGNNRCVRFDRSGNVIWELSRFNDAPLDDSNGNPLPVYTNGTGSALVSKYAPLLAPGEPTTLNHPTSVTSHVQSVYNKDGTLAGTIVHYLIADTGNSRIVEVADAFGPDGTPVGVPHDLVWVSRTADALGRHYAYTDANYFDGPNGLEYVIALVTNASIATIPSTGAGTMAPASDDGRGSSIVRLDYDPTGANPTTQKDGFISRVATSFYATLNTTNGPLKGTFDLADAPVLEQTGGNPPYQNAPTPLNDETVLPLRNPRFLEAYTPPGSTASTTSENFLLADDNGVWDLFFNSAGQPEAQWGFTQVDYQNLPGNIPGITVPIVGVTRTGVPFLPNSLERIGTDPITVGGTNYLMGRYLVTNGYSAGSVTPISSFGGEVLELGDQPPSGTPALETDLINSFNKMGTTGPLSQPSFANQEK
jgi:hypothetical protein